MNFWKKEKGACQEHGNRKTLSFRKQAERSAMVLQNIYIINSGGLCPLSLKIGSIEMDPDLVAGVFAASQSLWERIAGKAPKIISFQDMNAYIKPFSTGEKDWYLILVSEEETPELMKKVEDVVLKVVEENKELFENFAANTVDINTIVGGLIINELAQIPCPHMSKRRLKQICEIDGKQLKNFNCNLVSIAMCNTKISNPQKKNSLS
jgi:hypothetical protein